MIFGVYTFGIFRNTMNNLYRLYKHGKWNAPFFFILSNLPLFLFHSYLFSWKEKKKGFYPLGLRST